MTKYAIDAYAWIEYLAGTKEGLKVKGIVEDEKNDINTCAVTVAEVISKLVRQQRNPDIANEAIRTLSKVIPVDNLLADSAGRQYAEIRKKVKDFGLADAFVMAMAKSSNLKVVTKDPHFKHFKNTLFI